MYDAFRPNLTSAEADKRIAMMLTAKFKLANRRIRSELAASAGLSQLGAIGESRGGNS
jgi:hypothetical protein